MNILITGPRDSGKTTIVSAYLNNSSIAVVPEAAIQFLKNDPEIVKDPDFQQRLFTFQKSYISDAIRRKNKAEVKGIICDRWPGDNLIYIDMLQAKYPAKRFYIPSGMLEYIRNETKFDQVFLCDPRDIEFDPERGTAWKGEDKRMEEFDRFRKLYDSLGIEYTVLSGTVEQRLEVVDRVFSEAGIEVNAERVLTLRNV